MLMVNYFDILFQTNKMVRILKTGEIVSDDDPRAQQGNARPRQVEISWVCFAQIHQPNLALLV